MPPDLTAAKTVDREIENLNDLPEEVRTHTIEDLILRIRGQPNRYAAPLAYNLAVSATEATAPDTLQQVTTVLVDAIQKLLPKDREDSQYKMLAELARYHHMQVSLDDPRYASEISKLEANDQHCSEADFTLTDVQERKWNLRSLRGKVVLVNFFATWCPPCRREIPDLREIYGRFRDRGLVILAITDEEVSKVKPFLAQQEVTYPVLLDPGQRIRGLFPVDGFPESIVYDREGHFVATAMDRSTMSGFLDMLERAGLH